MGRKFLLIDGKQVEVPDGMLPVPTTELICFGQVVEYKTDSGNRIGKITGATRDGLIIISRPERITKSGLQFSMTEVDKINKTDIIRKVN